ncbi:MAG: SDR family oxidoreductase [Methylocystis sp.]|uniref:SDR family oxidoreductase n=1 Tax=Methylocystis sp. TaxID=1911079 RepID=UPI003DA5635F
MENAADQTERDTSSNDAPVAVVTGGSAGVGRAIAAAFAQRGFRVALLARGQAGLDGAREDVERLGGEPLAITTDVANPKQVDAAARHVADRWGRIDVWVNAAMETVVGPVDTISAEEFKRVTEVTYLGYVHGTLAALRHMRPRGAGTIIQIGSALAYRAIPLQSAYCASKFAIRGFTDSLRTELIHDRSPIRLTMVQLPGVNTPQFDWSHMHFAHRHQPIGACYEPEAVAQAVVDIALSSHIPRELWLGLPTLQAIAGAMAAPGFTDRYLARHSYEQQISDDPVLPGDPDELLGPDSKDHGARGRFTKNAKNDLIAVDPFHLRSGAVLAGLGLLAGAFLLGRSSGGAQARGARRPNGVRAVPTPRG